MLRRAFTHAELTEQGISRSAIRWKVEKGEWQRLARGLYIEGPALLSHCERALAVVVATSGVASGSLAAMLHGFDGVVLRGHVATVPASRQSRLTGVRRYSVDAARIVEVEGYPCTDGLQTLLDLASQLNDVKWEQALESALRLGLTTVGDVQGSLTQRRAGNGTIRRVLALRGVNVPPTGSVLETLMVQLIRSNPSLPTPARQVEVRSKHGTFIARVDLAWPDQGLFLELDGQQHKGQPVYDSRRETNVIAATGWLPGRFTWAEVHDIPNTTLRRVSELFKVASSRRYVTSAASRASRVA